MFEKYLSEKNISISEIQKLFPDLADLIQSYQDISGAEGFEDELNKIGREIISLLKDRESKIDAFVQSRPAFSEEIESTPDVKSESETEIQKSIPTDPDEVYIDLGLEESEVEKPEQDFIIETGDEITSPKVEVVGKKFTDVDFKQDMFLKILSGLGMDFHPKVASWNEGKLYWIKDDKNYFITDGMPFDKKTDVWAFGSDNMSNIIQSKVNYKVIEDITTDAPIEGLTDAINTEAKDPITGMTFKQVNEAIQDVFKIDSMPKLVTLLEISRKYGCGCGHI